MDEKKKHKLKSQSWKVSDINKFMELSKDEIAYIDLKITLGNTLHRERKIKKLTQVEFAKIISTNQACVARMEKGDPSISIDRIIRSLLSLGYNKTSLGKALTATKQTPLSK